MTDYTIKTLSQLLVDVRDTYERRHHDESLKINKSCIEQTFMNLKPASILNDKTPSGVRNYGGNILTEFSQISALIAKNYPKGVNFRRKRTSSPPPVVDRVGHGNRGKIQSFFAEYSSQRKGALGQSDWFHRRLIGPLLVAIALTLSSVLIGCWSTARTRPIPRSRDASGHRGAVRRGQKVQQFNLKATGPISAM